MKSFFVAILALVAIAIASEDDGQYHPYKNNRYDLRYFTSTETPYTVAARNGKYDSIYSAYQPFYKALQPPKEVITPLVKYGDQIAQDQLSTAAPTLVTVPVTYRTVYSTPAPLLTKPTYTPYYKQDYSQLRNEFDLDTQAKTYHYIYQTGNGITAEESGRNDGTNRVSGFYEYFGADGVKYRVDYTADEFGFHPRGAHLPV